LLILNIVFGETPVIKVGQHLFYLVSPRFLYIKAWKVFIGGVFGDFFVVKAAPKML